MKLFASMSSYAIPLALILIASLPPGRAQAAEVPITQIVIYKHGVAFFERSGSVAAGEEARLDFKTAEMNDVLKSFTVTDLAGGRVTGVRYDANEPLDQQLAKFPFNLGDSEFVSAFIDRMKGAQIELKTGDATTTGTIMSARAIESGAGDDKRLVREQVTLLLGTGEIANFDLSNVSSFRLTDPQLQDALKQYLQALARGKSTGKRSIHLSFDGSGRRDLRISYVTPAAIWKSSYRLGLEGKSSTLEGWAIVDNTSDQDWTNVKLAVVSGRPISFVSLLDVPRYGNRQVAELPEDRAAGPVVYGGSLESRASIAPGQGSGFGAGSGGGSGGGVYKSKQFVANQSLKPLPVPGPETAQSAVSIDGGAISSVEGASGETLGELFEYNFATPVTVKKNESAMLPFLQDKVEARKLLIYNNTAGEHPVNAAEIVNSTEKTLDGGPITVYDGGAYAGEALFETLKAGDKRLIGYAVDYGTRITTSFGSGNQHLREVHIRDGNLQMKSSTVETQTYLVKNIDPKPKTLIVEQPATEQYTLLSPKPSERTARAYRFEVRLGAGQTQELKVQQEHVLLSTTELSNAAPNFLVALIANKELGENARKQIEQISALKQNIIDADSEIAGMKAHSDVLNGEQNRLRQNIDSLNRVKGQEEQVRQYSGQLAANELELRKLRDQITNRSEAKTALERSLRELVERLEF